MKERIRPILLNPDETIEGAMRSMEEGKSVGAPAGIAIVSAADSNTVAGVVTDGDIRRALVGGVDLSEPVRSIMSEDPLCISDASSPTEMLGNLHDELDRRNESENKYHHILIVDGAGAPLDIATPFELWKRSEVRINTASVLGLGYVGLTLALTLADNGISVYGIETDDRKRAALESGTPHFFERGLEPLLQEHLDDKFHVRGQIDDVRSDIFIMCVNTPTTADGEFDSNAVEQAAEDIGRNIEVHDLVLVRSTVVVGTCRHTIVPIIEDTSGLVAGRDFYLAYAPERTVAGRALKELKTLPQVIGGINSRSVDYASQVFQTFSKNTIPVSSIEAAEMTKLLNNCYRDLIFSFANETAKLSERWNLDAHEVIEAANEGYSRNQIPKPSPGVGGPCLVKDPHLLIASGNAVGYQPHLPRASRSINEGMIDLVVQKAAEFVDDSEAKLFLMGMAYKGQPETSDVRNSPSMEIHRKLIEDFDDVQVYDPVVPTEQLERQGAIVVEAPEQGFDGASCVLVLTNHPSFTSLDINSLCKRMAHPGLLFDPWALYSEEETKSQTHTVYDRFNPH